jgi:hypothetical protein
VAAARLLAAGLCLALVLAAAPAGAQRCLACHPAGRETTLEALAGPDPWHPAEAWACPARTAARRGRFLTASLLERLSIAAAEVGGPETRRRLERLELDYHQALGRPVRSAREAAGRLAGLRRRLHAEVQKPLWQARRGRELWSLAGWAALAAALLAGAWLLGRRRRRKRGAGPLDQVRRGSLSP